MIWRVACIALAILALGLLALPASADNVANVPAKGKVIELAICLDTSNSMDGLIGSAKQKLWDIVNDLAKAKPTPTLKVGLFSYGNDNYDRTTGWVRKELDLSTDLDKVSEKLFGLTTRGGTEYVGRVTRDAIDQLKWSDDPATLKIIFVCGNESAHQDPEIKLKSLAETAVRKNIIVNTIYCGPANHSDAVGYKEFADMAEGRYAFINQEKGKIAIATPFDKDLNELSGKINHTFCFWGKDAKELADNQKRQDENAAKLPGAGAARAESKAGGIYRFQDADLVEKLKMDPKFDVKKIPVEELNDEMKKMTPEEREKHVKKLLTQREELQKQINDLSKKRADYIAEETRKNPNAADKAFDEAVRGALREQCKKKGLEIPEPK